jgi:hypothetical protein
MSSPPWVLGLQGWRYDSVAAVETQAARVLPRARWVSPCCEPAQPAPRVRIPGADHAGLPAVASGAASPRLAEASPGGERGAAESAYQASARV